MTDLAGSLLLSKIRGCLYGGAIGDALGAPAEGHEPDEIRVRYDWITDFVEPWHGPSPIGKGDGRYTDDTHMVQVLSQVYVDADDTLDVFRFAQAIVPPIADRPRWLAERGQEMPLVDRLFYPEKWLLMRLRLANVDPRTSGIGNMVNCGAAMYAAPVGIVHAGDANAAYREAIEIFSAHQTSYGLEAAGVMAACVAEALRPAASLDSVIDVALDLANEGTKTAISAVIARARDLHDWRAAIAPLREAIRPYDGAATDFHDRGNGSDDWHPSRVRSIEELPIALGLMLVAGGDFAESIAAGANYGRDCDSIASMAGAITGALHGDTVIPQRWIERINTANRIDLDPLATGLAQLAVKVQQRQVAAAEQRAAEFRRLVTVG